MNHLHANIESDQTAGLESDVILRLGFVPYHPLHVGAAVAEAEAGEEDGRGETHPDSRFEGLRHAFVLIRVPCCLKLRQVAWIVD